MIKNFFKVDDIIYRGAQPTHKGMRELVALGIKSVINLRRFHDDKDEARGMPLKLYRIASSAGHPEDEDVLRFLQLMANPKNHPVFVHCLHGSDRTGIMCAMYRIVFQGWTNEAAVQEMLNGGFGFHAWLYKSIPEYLYHADGAALRKMFATTKRKR